MIDLNNHQADTVALLKEMNRLESRIGSSNPLKPLLAEAYKNILEALALQVSKQLINQ